MDEVLLRRLLGAAVLLAIAFVLAALLPEPRRSPPGGELVVSYDLVTGKALAPHPAPPLAKTAPASPPKLKVDETLGTTAGGWYVQVGSFESQANARGVLQKLFGMGMPTVIQSVSVGKSLWYRVRVGPYPREDAAQRALERIRQQGYTSAALVRPESAPAPSRN
jgi:cell division protein FtsN